MATLPATYARLETFCSAPKYTLAEPVQTSARDAISMALTCRSASGMVNLKFWKAGCYQLRSAIKARLQDGSLRFPVDATPFGRTRRPQSSIRELHSARTCADRANGCMTCTSLSWPLRLGPSTASFGSPVDVSRSEAATGPAGYAHEAGSDLSHADYSGLLALPLTFEQQGSRQ